MNNTNAGTELPGIRFGTGVSGAAISSARTSGSTNEAGLDFYTASRRVMAISPSSEVAMGVPPPLDTNTQLAVSANGFTTAFNAFSAVAFSSAGDTFSNGGIGGSFTGGLGDHNNGFSDGDGIDATNAGGGLASGGGFAGNFTGDVNVSHQIFASVKDFKIDHPLDPANKYLLHSSVESSEMMNIYTGNVVLDGSGQATIELPDWSRPSASPVRDSMLPTRFPAATSPSPAARPEQKSPGKSPECARIPMPRLIRSSSSRKKRLS